MDSIAIAKNEYRIKEWAKIVQACRTSGMTVVAWCARNNINIKSYYYWLRKLRSMVCQSETLPAAVNEQPIVPLSIKPVNIPVNTAVITIHLPAASIDICNGASREVIESVLAAMKTIC